MKILKYDKGFYDLGKVECVRYWGGEYKRDGGIQYQLYTATVQSGGNTTYIEVKKPFVDNNRGGHEAKEYFMTKIEAIMKAKMSPENKGQQILVWEEL